MLVLTIQIFWISTIARSHSIIKIKNVILFYFEKFKLFQKSIILNDYLELFKILLFEIKY